MNPLKKLNLQNLSRPEAFQTGISKLVRKTVLANIKLVREPILDACCGNGIFLLEYCVTTDNYQNITGVDLDQEALQTAELLFSDNDMKCPIFQQQNAMELTFNDNTFNSIFCLNTLLNIHPFENIEKIITELYRVLKPGGKIFIDFRNQQNLVLNLKYKQNIKTGKLTTYAHNKSDFDNIIQQLKIKNYSFQPIGNPFAYLAKGYLLIIEK